MFIVHDDKYNQLARFNKLVDAEAFKKASSIECSIRLGTDYKIIVEKILLQIYYRSKNK